MQETKALQANSGRSRRQSTVWWIAVLGFPLSLSSPGATVSMALVALYGLGILLRGDRLSPDLYRVHRFMTACYALLLGADLLNGATYTNLTTTGVNYLPLLALAPYAHALRRLRFSASSVETAVQVTIILAIAISLFRFGA